MPISKEGILEKFKLFNGQTGGIDSWLSNAKNEVVFERLGKIKEDPLSMVQLNQLLVLSHEAGVSEGFFEHYWLSNESYAYDVSKLEGYDKDWFNKNPKRCILSLDHLKWGLYRLYIDALLYFGNIRSAYRSLR